MGFKVIITPQALRDLEEIVTFIAKNDPEQARKLGNKLIDRALSVAAFPTLGRMVPEIGLPTVREIIHRSYRIIYEIFEERQNRVFAAILAWGERGAGNRADRCFMTADGNSLTKPQ